MWWEGVLSLEKLFACRLHAHLTFALDCVFSSFPHVCRWTMQLPECKPRRRTLRTRLRCKMVSCFEPFRSRYVYSSYGNRFAVRNRLEKHTVVFSQSFLIINCLHDCAENLPGCILYTIASMLSNWRKRETETVVLLSCLLVLLEAKGILPPFGKLLFATSTVALFSVLLVFLFRLSLSFFLHLSCKLTITMNCSIFAVLVTASFG